MYPRERAAEALARPTGPGRETPCLAYVELELASTERDAGVARNTDHLFTDARRILDAAEDEERRRERRI